AIFDRPGVEALWREEHESTASSQAFLGAPANYSSLSGIQINLFKCFLPVAWRSQRVGGASGFLHPESIYDDPAGMRLRQAAYLRLRRHYQFANALFLFAEVHDQQRFSINVYGQQRETPSFVHIANLFHPSTVKASHEHLGAGAVPGIK